MLPLAIALSALSSTALTLTMPRLRRWSRRALAGADPQRYHDWAPADTLAGHRDRLRVAVHEHSFKKAMAAGVKIAFSTDMGGIAWTEPIAQEFSRMTDFGMTPMGAIQSATTRAAALLDMEGKLGVIAPGAYADVIAVSGDPLGNINALENVQFVMKDGQVFKTRTYTN